MQVFLLRMFDIENYKCDYKFCGNERVYHIAGYPITKQYLDPRQNQNKKIDLTKNPVSVKYVNNDKLYFDKGEHEEGRFLVVLESIDLLISPAILKGKVKLLAHGNGDQSNAIFIVEGDCKIYWGESCTAGRPSLVARYKDKKWKVCSTWDEDYIDVI